MKDPDVKWILQRIIVLLNLTTNIILVANHRFTEGRAWLSSCPVASCERPVIEAHVDGLILRLDTKAVPWKDALILDKYDRLLVNIWKGPTQLWAVAWFAVLDKPDKGHIYTQHIHGRRR